VTLINLRGFIDALPAPVPASGAIVKLQRWAGRAPAVLLDGPAVTFPAQVQIDAGNLSAAIDVPPTDGRYCIRWTIVARGIANLRPIYRYTAIPAGGPVDFADLIDVDPMTFQPSAGATAAWLAALIEVAQLADEAAERAAAAGTSAFQAGASAATALGHANDADASADDAAAEAAAATLARTGAEQAASQADFSASAAATAHAGAETAATLAGGAAVAATTAAADADADRIAAQTAAADADADRIAAQAAANLALTGQFSGTVVPGAGMDVNEATTPGVYRVSATAGAASPGLPAGYSAGILEVFNVVNVASVIQRFTPFGNGAPGAGMFIRRRNGGTGTGTGWNAWRFVASQRIDSPAGQPGAGIYTWDEIAGVERQLMPAGIDLGTTDLNAVTVAGVYIQPNGTRATTARNYPIALRGTVSVVAVSATEVLQRYTPSTGVTTGEWVRKLAGTTWSAWWFVAGQRVDQTAGRAIYAWDSLNGREQLIYGDTGWREVALENGWTGSLRVRRVGGLVELNGINLVAGAGQSIYTLGAGFAPSRIVPVIARPAVSTNPPVYGSVSTPSGVVSILTGYALHATSLSMSFTTLDPWPTVLPGTPVGSIPA
jgi:hypothetical protein